MNYVLKLQLLIILLLSPLADNTIIAQTRHQKEKITILILDKSTGTKLENVVVRADNKYYITDSGGRIRIPAKNKITLTISSIGYKTVENRVYNLKGIKKLTIYLEATSYMIEQINITARKKHTNKLQQTFTIEQELLERNTALSLSQILEKVPGVSMISSGGTIAKPVIQGMHSSRILLLNNGVRLQSQSWGEDHAPEIDHTESSIIEVVKGAEAVRYGYGAVGGVVLFNQAPLPFAANSGPLSVDMNYGYNSNGRRFDASSTVETGSDHLALRIHGMYQKAGDYSTADYVLNNTGYTNISMSANGGYKTERLTARLYTSLYSSRAGIYYASKISDIDQLMIRFEKGRPDDDSFYPAGYPVDPPFQQTQHFTIKGDIEYRLSKSHKLSLTLSHQDNIRQEFENRKEDALSWLPIQDLELSSYGAELIWDGKWDKFKMSTQSGLSGSYQKNYNVPGTKQPAFIPNYAAITMGMFLIHKLTLGRLQLSGGMRYDLRGMDVNGYSSLHSFKYYTDFKVYRNIIGSLASHYQLNEKINLRANIGWSWRPPDINELYASGLHHGIYWVVGNMDLKSERGYKAVFGSEYSSSLITISPSIFYQHVDNYIYDNIGEGINRFHNHPSGKYPQFIYGQDNVRIYGGDLTTILKPAQGLDLSLKGEWIYARNITQDNWLPFMPSDRYTLNGRYQTYLERHKIDLSCSFEAMYVSKQKRFDPAKDLVPSTPPAYTLINAEAEIGFQLKHGKKMKIIIMGDNIFNKLYKEYTDRFRYYAHASGSNFTLRTVFEL